ncbi:MAG: hypothetical protein AABY54_04085 [Deltaproteobacteria bacterium]
MTFIAPAITEAFGPQNPPSGFHELSWGVDIGNMKGFKLEKSDKYGKHYSRNNEDLAFEGVPLKSVTYKTFENKLHMVTLTFEGQSNFEKLASNSKNKYAEYSELKSEHGFNKDIEYSWYFYYFSKSEKKHIATVRLKYDFTTNKGELSLSNMQYSPPLRLYFNE